MIQYKVYRIVGNEELPDGVLRQIVEDASFTWYESMEEAFQRIKEIGDDYVDYTVLPVLRMD
jgi:hypothetical protein